MQTIDDQYFDKLITKALDELPKKYTERLDNVAITYADEPSAQQREQLKLRCHDLLFGLYEGVPLTKRNGMYSGVLPDRITIFKNPLLAVSSNEEDFKNRIKRTLWHEIAHFFGLDHSRIHKIESKMRAL
jgi:predicted Zn-dependent protease with MMP-like domain